MRELEGNLNFKDILRKNAILLAEHHKKYCEGMECEISLHLLRELLKGKHKIELSKEEEAIFF